jgi:hypothetical protein
MLEEGIAFQVVVMLFDEFDETRLGLAVRRCAASIGRAQPTVPH